MLGNCKPVLSSMFVACSLVRQFFKAGVCIAILRINYHKRYIRKGYSKICSIWLFVLTVALLGWKWNTRMHEPSLYMLNDG